MIKLSTINLLVEGVLDSAQKRYEVILKDSGLVVEKIRKERAKKLAENEVNALCISLKAASICEISGIDAALDYYEGAHTDDEFQEFRTGVVLPKLEKMKKGAKKNENKRVK